VLGESFDEEVFLRDYVRCWFCDVCEVSLVRSCLFLRLSLRFLVLMMGDVALRFEVRLWFLFFVFLLDMLRYSITRK